jgi:hypothetical protein
MTQHKSFSLNTLQMDKTLFAVPVILSKQRMRAKNRELFVPENEAGIPRVGSK